MKKKKKTMRRKKNQSKLSTPLLISVGTLGVLLVSTFFIISAAQQRQDNRSQAAVVNCDIPDSDIAVTAEEQKMLDLVNAHRQANGASPLKFSQTLNRSAAWQSNDMSKRNVLDHTDSLGRDPGTRMTDCGVPGKNTGENVAYNSNSTPETIFNSWKNSSGHNQNMLNSSYTVIGIAKSGIYWTQNFNATDDSSAVTPQLTNNPSVTGGLTGTITTTPVISLATTPITASGSPAPTSTIPSPVCLGACPTNTPEPTLISRDPNASASPEPRPGFRGGGFLEFILFLIFRILFGGFFGRY